MENDSLIVGDHIDFNMIFVWCMHNRMSGYNVLLVFKRRGNAYVTNI
jgi:hypothetical protein